MLEREIQQLDDVMWQVKFEIADYRLSTGVQDDNTTERLMQALLVLQLIKDKRQRTLESIVGVGHEPAL